ncbi:hypothetical protein D3871_28140 [Noviherbaspirillum saxi]|uniref:Wadjet protein JetD C-terminal domain-containing protein n=2 Tax=Noviherbaspirillum saxi TaxID=2320863 RepID=A0A3A3FKC0_9BURK|nr:hypothetical protein D3871_28140 [Noviherbaspirillum saxi]
MGWLTARHDRSRHGEAPYQLKPRIDIRLPEQIRSACNRPQRVKSPAEIWREAVAAHLESPESVKEKVSRYCIDIPGRSAEEIVRQLNLLPTLKDQPLLLREVSARLFWRLSKVLAKRQEMVQAILGLDECPFPEMPVLLNVWLPQEGFNEVLFIENITTFERATQERDGRFKNVALVFSSGYKSSAMRMRTSGGASLYFAQHGTMNTADTARFHNWLMGAVNLPIYFWGDMDYAGMDILRSLRLPFPDAQAWKPGYEPMAQALQAGHGHTPEEAGKAGQNSVETTGCEYADTMLLPVLRASGRFIDQESL